MLSAALDLPSCSLSAVSFCSGELHGLNSSLKPCCEISYSRGRLSVHTIHYHVRRSHERRSSLVIDLFSFRPHATVEFCCHSIHLVAVLRLCLRTSVAFYYSPAISLVAALLVVMWRRLASVSTPKLSPLRPTVFFSRRDYDDSQSFESLFSFTALLIGIFGKQFDLYILLYIKFWRVWPSWLLISYFGF